MLRGQGLKDLIYRYDPGSEPKPLVAGVRLTLSEGDEGGRLTLGRHITPGGSSQYSLQGKTVSWEEYEVALELRQVFPKAPPYSLPPLPLICLAQELSRAAGWC